MREAGWSPGGVLPSSLRSGESRMIRRGTGEGPVQAGTMSPPVILMAELGTGLGSLGLRAHASGRIQVESVYRTEIG